MECLLTSEYPSGIFLKADLILIPQSKKSFNSLSERVFTLWFSEQPMGRTDLKNDDLNTYVVFIYFCHELQDAIPVIPCPDLQQCAGSFY